MSSYSRPPRPTLLLVDDQVVNVQILKPIFKDEYEVCMATSGVQALAFCVEHAPDLILLDVLMPGIDGYQVCKELKANPQTRDIPVIFVTTCTDPDDESTGLALGAVDFLSKPVNASVVRARVRTHMMLGQTLHQVQDLNENLEARVEQRTSELKLALANLRQTRPASSDACLM